MIRRAVRWVDGRTGTGPVLRKALRYVFPDHWTFLLGEITLFSFLVLLGTGVYLTFFFEPSLHTTVYDGPYAPLAGQEISRAYDSALQISLEVKGGLLIRQTHHWAALTFVAAMTLHMMRVFFTGAFRRPRELNWYVGVTLLTLALAEGFTGYSLPDDLLSGMGLAIAYSVALAIPLVGANLGLLAWGGEFPGVAEFEPRLYILHVLLLPAILATLIGIHLLLITRPRHTQFAGPGRREATVHGSPLWPGYLLRATGLMLATAAVLFLLGGLVQINPIWQYGPYEPWQGTNGAQPDWYLGWLIGALRLMPAWELTIGGHTIIPNPFFGGVLFPGLVFAALYLWPAIEKRLTGDRAVHHLLDRPRDAPVRTAVGAALFTLIALVFLAGASDRIFVDLGIPYRGQVLVFRVLVFLGPILAFLVAKRICEELGRSGDHPVRSSGGRLVRRLPGGGFSEEPLPRPDDEAGGSAA